ncbi:hypothetical protein Tco_0816012 [Tanacetum coccineum]
MTTLADKAILSGADNHPPMLEKDMYDSWKSIMELYMMNRQHGRMILESVENGPLIWPSIEENGVTRPKKYSELSATEAIQADCDIKATNIILQGLPPEFKDKVLLVQAQASGQIIHEEELAFLADPRIPEGQATQTAMPSSKQSNVVSHSKTEITSDSNIIPYSQYVIESQQVAVQNSNSSAQQDELILSVIEQLKTQVVNCTKINMENKSVNDTLTAELERYKEQVKVLKEGKNVDLRSNDTISDSSAQSVEFDRLKLTLSEHLKEKESLMQTVTLLKNDFKDQSAQTVHMLTKPQFFYDHTTKQALDFESRFVPQTELFAEQAFWSKNSPEPTLSRRPTKVEVPKELPKVGMVNTSLKKLKYHLAGFDMVAKERTTPTAITEGSWGFEHTKACFRDEIIPFDKL